MSGGPDAHRALLRSLMDPGAVIVEGMPQDHAFDGSVLQDFATHFFGGLQKHPRRENPHWSVHFRSAAPPPRAPTTRTIGARQIDLRPSYSTPAPPCPLTMPSLTQDDHHRGEC